MKPILNLNKHPKDCENLSLVNAKNVRLSNDGSCLQSENKLIECDIINQTFNDAYANGYNIINAIECNTELVIFVVDVKHITDTVCYVDLWRFNESFNQCKKVYTGFNYNYGEIIGAFTYNVNNELIIAISEYDANIDVPLRTINLGKFEEDKEQLPNELLPINPEVYVPTLTDYNYVIGNLPKGWYHIFVRYKIDNTDYTKWLDVGGDILVNDIEKQSIFKLYGYKSKDGVKEPFSVGVLDHFSTEEEITNESIQLKLSCLDNRYKHYQIGFISHNTSNIIAYHSADINVDIDSYIIDLNIMSEINYTELLMDNYNPYNAKSIINYKNRLYVSNYKESLLQDIDVSGIKVELINDDKEYKDIAAISYLSKDESLDTYRTIDKENPYYAESFINDYASPDIIKNLYIDNKIYNTLFDSNVVLEQGKKGTITLKDKDGNYKPQISFDGFYVIIKDLLKIKTGQGKVLNVEFYLQRFIIDTIVNHGTVEFKYTINNKIYKAKGRTIYKDDYNLESIEFVIQTSEITSDILTPTLHTEKRNSSRYVNVKNSYNDRRKNTTLIPGEIYNFYIHFVDKYGFETKGFKLTPKSILDGYVPVILNYSSETYGNYKYALMKPNTNIFDKLGNIQISDCVSVLNVFVYDEELKRFMIPLECFIDQEGIEKALIEQYGSLSKNTNIKWEDVSIGNIDTVIYNGNQEQKLKFPIYLNYYNNTGESYFKIPYVPIETKIINGEYTYNYPNLKINVSNVQIPDGYVGYFISYEKVEDTCKCTGILTKYDFNDVEYENGSKLFLYNKGYGTKMYFYTSDFDVLDKIDLQYNVLRVENKNSIKPSDNNDYIVNSVIQNINNLNAPEYKSEEEINVSYHEISDYKILVGSDAIKNRYGLGTCLELTLDEDLFPTDSITIYKASLLHINNSNYISKDKQLIKCTNTIYPNKFTQSLVYYLNGKNTYNNFIVYDNNKFVFDETKGRVITDTGKEYLSYGDKVDITPTDSKFLAYIQLPVYKSFFYETKSFKNKPKAVNFRIDGDEESTNIQLGLVVEPKNSIDLFENKFVHPDNYCPKFYTNHRTDIKYLEEFDKMIRRSDIIQDESYSNSWRRFGLENYKVISENKGKITNIVGIGYYLLVHTEHSLFAFNSSNTLKTLDKDIQLATPDIFDLDYQELITSELGYAGLQDRKAWCLDTFGYIFYDNDNERLFRFDEGKLDYIDGDIIQFLNKYKPDHIKFGVDKEANRILIKLIIPDIKSVYDLTLSYNYSINKFISFHDYTFDNTYNTKTKLYLLDKEYNKFYEFNYDNLRQVNYSYNKTQLEFIINDNYYKVKYLEYIIYRLFNIAENTKDYNQINNISPVEELRKPYSGIRIRVYNDEVDTGWLDISVNQESLKNVFANFNKPYWDKGNWNFSYLRDKDTKSRLYGNYFVVCFEFGGDEMRYEFETLGYNITKDRRI